MLINWLIINHLISIGQGPDNNKVKVAVIKKYRTITRTAKPIDIKIIKINKLNQKIRKGRKSCLIQRLSGKVLMKNHICIWLQYNIYTNDAKCAFKRTFKLKKYSVCLFQTS